MNNNPYMKQAIKNLEQEENMKFSSRLNDDAKSKIMEDLRVLLLQLYLKNNPRLTHSIYIYSFSGVANPTENPFRYVSGDLPPNVKKSVIVQNIPSGEMLQAFITPVTSNGSTTYQIENKGLYGNKSGTLIEIDFTADAVSTAGKYRQFISLTKSLLHQFI